MAINATTNPREITPAGTFIARCFQMIEIGTITEPNSQGEMKTMRKCQIGWELPGELNQYGESFTITQEYTLSMNEKANLRKMLQSWRGKEFTPEQAKSFDITVLLGKPCMVSIIHKTSAKGNNYATITGITTLPKGVECPPQVNASQLLQYDNFDETMFDKLPEFLKDKLKGSEEYQKLYNMQTAAPDAAGNFEPIGGSDLPF